MTEAYLVDSHCHLDFPDYEGEREAVIARARAAGVGAMLTIGTGLDRFDGMRAIAESHEGIWCTVGVHPHEAGRGEAAPAPERLMALAAHPEVVGIGETGLDFHYRNSNRETQQTSFRNHLAAARESGLPVVVHTRDSDPETIAILHQESANSPPDRPLRGLIHCFSSNREFAEKALEIGFYISISGIITFDGAQALRETVHGLPMERILVETDAPYLAPVPERGKRNEPAFVAHTAARVAEIMEVTPREFAEVTTDNFFRLFKKARRPA